MSEAGAKIIAEYLRGQVDYDGVHDDNDPDLSTLADRIAAAEGDVAICKAVEAMRAKCAAIARQRASTKNPYFASAGAAIVDIAEVIAALKTKIENKES